MNYLLRRISHKESSYLEDVLRVVNEELEGRYPRSERLQVIAKDLKTDEASSSLLGELAAKISEELTVRKFISDTFEFDPEAPALTIRQLRNEWREWKRCFGLEHSVKESLLWCYLRTLDVRSSETEIYGLKISDPL